MIPKYGLFLGAFWALSFVFTVQGLSVPGLGILGDVVGIMSIFAAGNMLRRIQEQWEPEPVALGYASRLRLSLRLNMCATMVCTFIQTLYMKFVDGGQIMETITQLYSDPQYQESLQTMMPGVTLQQITQMIQSISISQLIIQFLLINIVIGVILAPLSAIYGKK